MFRLIKILMCLIIFCLANTVSGQNENINVLKRVDISEQSKTEKVIIGILEETIRFSLNISCNTNKGAIKIEIYDPNGEKFGNFSIENSFKQTNLNEIVSGQLHKTIEYPHNGDWIIKIIPNKAIATISISCNLLKKSD